MTVTKSGSTIYVYGGTYSSPESAASIAAAYPGDVTTSGYGSKTYTIAVDLVIGTDTSGSEQDTYFKLGDAVVVVASGKKMKVYSYALVGVGATLWADKVYNAGQSARQLVDKGSGGGVLDGVRRLYLAKVASLSPRSAGVWQVQTLAVAAIDDGTVV